MAVDRRSIELGKGHVTLATDRTALEKGLDAAAAKFRNTGKLITGIAAGIGAAGALISAPFLKGLSVFADWGAEVTIASRRTGIEFGQLQQLAYATGGDLDSLSASIDKMSSFLEKAAEGGAEANTALAALGLTFTELNAMNQHDRFLAVADGLNSIADAGQRAALRRQLLGRGAGTLNLSGGAAGVRGREARAVELGQAFSPADQASVKAYNLAMKELNAVIRATWATLGAAIAPFMTQFTKFVTDIVQRVRVWIRDNRELVAMIFRVGDVLVTAGIILGAIGGAIYAVGFALPIVVLGLKFLAFGLLIVIGLGVSLWTVFKIAEGILSSLGTTFTEIGSALILIVTEWTSIIETWTPIFEELSATVVQAFGAISDAISAGEWVMAINVAWITIKLIWAQGINWIRDAWFSFTYIYNNTLDGMILSIGHTMIAIVGLVSREINRLIDLMPAFIRTRLGIERVSFDEGAANRALDTEAFRRERERAAERAAERERARLEEAGLRGELDDIASEAAHARDEAYERSLEMPEAPDTTEGFDRNKGSVIVGTSNQLLFGSIGSVGGQSPAERAAHTAEVAAGERHRDTIDRLRAIERAAGVRFS